MQSFLTLRKGHRGSAAQVVALEVSVQSKQQPGRQAQRGSAPFLERTVSSAPTGGGTGVSTAIDSGVPGAVSIDSSVAHGTLHNWNFDVVW